MRERFHLEVLRLQKKMHRTLEIEADRVVGSIPKALHSYRRNYLNDFKASHAKKKLHSISRSELIEKIMQAPVTFVGDYHTFSQSQKTTLRLLRDVREATTDTTPFQYLGLELISSQYQKIVDDYLAGTVSRSEFLAVTRYDEEWGFPWKNFEPLFDWAKDNGIRIIALNLPKEFQAGKFYKGNSSSLYRFPQMSLGKAKDMEIRDQWAAGLITDLYAEHERSSKPGNFRMMVLYGDWHVARAHLPAQLKKISKNHLKKEIPSLIIHQNEDTLYWKLARQGKLQHSTNTYRLGPSCYCIFSGTPWGKLQSLLNWAEGDLSPELDADIERMAEEVRKIAIQLSELYRWDQQLNFDTTLTEIQGYTPLLLKRVSRLTAPKKRIAKYYIQRNEPFIFHEERFGFYAVNSSHHATELASALMYATLKKGVSLKGKRPRDSQVVEWIDLVFQSAFSFFSSLILNPRRKCDLPQDLENPRMAPTELKKRRLALRALRCKTPMALLRLLEEEIFPELPVEHIHSMTRLIGKIYGTALYRSITLHAVDVKRVKAIFEGHYQKLAENGFITASALESYFEFQNRLRPELAKLSTKRDFF